jgi:hypothetical protein
MNNHTYQSHWRELFYIWMNEPIKSSCTVVYTNLQLCCHIHIMPCVGQYETSTRPSKKKERRSTR